MYWQQIPPADQARLDELARVSTACRNAFHALVAETQWQPGKPSVAQIDLEALPCPDPRAPQSGVSSGFGLVSEVVSSYLTTAGGHLGAMAALYRAGEVFYLPPVAVRAVVENSARAMWVLGADPAETPGARLVRAYLEALLSDDEQKKNAGRMGDKTSPDYEQAVVTFRRRRAEVATIFPGTTADMISKGEVGGQKRPRPEECVIWMFDLLEREAGSTMTARQGEGLYGFLSSFTHPTLYPTQQMREWVQRGGRATAVARLDVDFLDREARLAVLVFYNAMSFVMSYFGWPTAHHNELTNLIDKAMPGIFIDGGTPKPAP